MTAANARLFVALELPDPIRDALQDWRESTVGNDAAWRPVAADALHVTLCFLGSQPVGEIEAIAAACALVPSDRSPVLRLAAPLMLPPRRPRALAVSLADPDEALGRLQSRLARELAAGGWYQPERRPYLAHVTVARPAGHQSRPRVRSYPVPLALTFQATTVSLLRSWPEPGGSRYERLVRTHIS